MVIKLVLFIVYNKTVSGTLYRRKWITFDSFCVSNYVKMVPRNCQF